MFFGFGGRYRVVLLIRQTDLRLLRLPKVADVSTALTLNDVFDTEARHGRRYLGGRVLKLGNNGFPDGPALIE